MGERLLPSHRSQPGIHEKFFYDRQSLLDDAVDFVAEEIGLLE